ncbi:TPA: hypothetical protein ACKRMY_006008 [Pseudomonas aeruginosa]
MLIFDKQLKPRVSIHARNLDHWQRDVLRVEGSVTDYCLIGEINEQALREFQSSHRSPAKPFKPGMDLKLILAARYCQWESEND